MILISAFNLYKGGSLRLHNEITDYFDESIQIVSFRGAHSKDSSRIHSVFYPVHYMNFVYRLLIEQFYILYLAIKLRAEKIIMMGNLPCVFWFGKQCIYFHNVDYLVKRDRSIKELLERWFFLFSVRWKRPIIFCQTVAVKDYLEATFGRNVTDVRVIPVPASKLKSTCEKILSDSKSMSDYYIYPTHDYKHKNIDMLYNISVRKRDCHINVTINNEEYGDVEHVSQIGSQPHESLLSQIAASKGMLFLSDYESLGYPLIECALLKVPLIALDRSYVHACVDTPYLVNNLDELEKYLTAETLEVYPTLKISLSTNEFFQRLKDA